MGEQSDRTKHPACGTAKSGPDRFKSNRSPHEEYLEKIIKGQDVPTREIWALTDDNGNQILDGVDQWLKAKYLEGDPGSKLEALREAQHIAISRLMKLGQISNPMFVLLAEIKNLLDDMWRRANNHLVRYARPPQGSPYSSHSDTDARRALAVAARALWNLGKVSGVVEWQTFKSSCQKVWEAAEERLEKIGGGSLSDRLPGGSRKDTPEKREQKKPPQTDGERVEGWCESFKEQKNPHYLLFLEHIKILKSERQEEQLEDLVDSMIVAALDRLCLGLTSEAKRERSRLDRGV